MKILGRGALLLTAGAFNLAWWVFAALLEAAGQLQQLLGAGTGLQLVVHAGMLQRLPRATAVERAQSLLRALDLEQDADGTTVVLQLV